MLDLLYQYYSGQYKLIEQLHLINHVQGLPLISLLSYSSSLPENDYYVQNIWYGYF